ncbi:MAG: hypothetical protein KA329_12850 [Novosphingobium sp.]|nr:hypothetical protein [Novosphingobium sp.]
MMGWILALALCAACFGALFVSKRCSRPALELALVAILIALAGYGWQGRPELAGQPTARPAAAN